MQPGKSIAAHLLSFGLIAAGALVFASTAKPLANDASLKTPLNVLGINTSPYGEVFAMAMQSSIDSTWSRGRDEAEPHPAKSAAAPSSRSLRGKFTALIDELSTARATRTNTKRESKAQEMYVRRQVENKLRFAYQLDPSHYGNFNSYHFFLTEPALGTRPELTPGAAKLAQRTIEYCLAKTDDPRPALTAAAAAENLLALMFGDRQSGGNHYSTAQMRQYLVLLDQCIARYHQLSAHWEATGNWRLISNQRRAESEDRLAFINKMRETAEKTIQRFEQESSPPASPSH